MAPPDPQDWKDTPMYSANKTEVHYKFKIFELFITWLFPITHPLLVLRFVMLISSCGSTTNYYDLFVQEHRRVVQEEHEREYQQVSPCQPFYIILMMYYLIKLVKQTK